MSDCLRIGARALLATGSPAGTRRPAAPVPGGAVTRCETAAIRDEEQKLGAPQHLIAVQGTGGWARFLSYYVTHPIQAGGGKNIVYETHPYNPTSDFQSLFVGPSATLPVIIGEFGPAMSMTEQDAIT